MPLITIAAITVPNWQGASAGVTLRVYANGSFTAQSGTYYPQTVQGNVSTPSIGTFFKSYPCTVASGALTIPAITLDSTTDSPDNPSATYSAVLFDGNSLRQIQPFGTFASFSLTPTPTPTTWAAIFATEEAEL